MCVPHTYLGKCVNPRCQTEKEYFDVDSQGCSQYIGWFEDSGQFPLLNRRIQLLRVNDVRRKNERS